ncbi:MAG TPA: hypothetical protein VN685_11905, partial [Rhizomicrobium sp.]|nr:hypothetical protein [Rhizomicrobium sp.]
MRAITGWMAAGVLLAMLPNAQAGEAKGKQVIDNERVTVWDLDLAPGESGLASPADFDSVILFLEGGEVRTSKAGGASSVAAHEFGDAVFVPKGSAAMDTATKGPVHEVMIALKGGPVPPNQGPPGMPNSFPRAGATKMFENDRAIAWKFCWPPGEATPMHHHDKDTVMSFRYDGPVRSTDPEGLVRILP